MTDIFEKAAKATKDVGDTVVSSAKSLGGSLYNSTKEQSELAGLNVQKSVLDKKLNDSDYFQSVRPGKRKSPLTLAMSMAL